MFIILFTAEYSLFTVLDSRSLMIVVCVYSVHSNLCHDVLFTERELHVSWDLPRIWECLVQSKNCPDALGAGEPKTSSLLLSSHYCCCFIPFAARKPPPADSHPKRDATNTRRRRRALLLRTQSFVSRY